MKKIRRKIYNVSKDIGDRLGFDLPYFVENGFWMVLNQGVSMLAGLATSVLFARYFTQEVYGEYQFILSVVAFFSFFSIPGLNPALIRSVAKGFDGDFELSVKQAVKYSFVGSLFILAIAIYYFFKNEHSIAYALIFSALSFPLLFSFDKWMALLKAKEKFEIFAKQSILMTVGKTFLIVLSIFLFPDYLLPVVISYLLGSSFFNIVLYLKNKKQLENKKTANDTLKYDGFITKLSILNTLVSHFDKILIGILDIKALAVYSIALGLINIIKNFIKSVTAITFPKFAKHNIRISFFQKIIIFIAGLVLSLILYFIADNLVQLLYTEKYLSSAGYFKIFVWIIPLFLISSILSKKILAEKNEKKLIHTRITVPVITLLSSVIVYFFTKNIEWFVYTKFFVFNLLNYIVLTMPYKIKP
ncbi:MAG: oligosaccharide flippase family protein [Bacteroidales bacterium]|nr:oligosaccharide flippase family protein [Bacteroidales bacterium]